MNLYLGLLIFPEMNDVAEIGPLDPSRRFMGHCAPRTLLLCRVGFRRVTTMVTDKRQSAGPLYGFTIFGSC